MSPEDEQVALITGANGVTGQYLVAQLAQEQKWTAVIATSRRPPYRLTQSARVHFHQQDLNKDVDAIMEALQEMSATRVTHLFHMAYIHHDSFEKQYEYNVPFFKNVLTAVERLNRNTLQRVVLQTGAKYYGQAYKAPPRQPIREDFGRLGLGGPPNFYYPQEDFIFELQNGKRWTWSVTRPFLISGVSAGTSCNEVLSPVSRRGRHWEPILMVLSCLRKRAVVYQYRGDILHHAKVLGRACCVYRPHRWRELLREAAGLFFRLQHSSVHQLSRNPCWGRKPGI